MTKHNKPRSGLGMDDVQPFAVTAYPNSYTYNIFVQSILESPEEFSEAMAALGAAGENDRVVIFLNSSGGSLESLDSFLFELADCKAHIHIRASGIIASAATFILLSGHSFEISPYAKVLFHSATFGNYAAAGEMVETSTFLRDECERLARDYYSPILTEDELIDIFKNKKEFWMTSEEFCKRFDAAQEIQKEKHQSMQEQLDGIMMEDDLPESILNKLTKKNLIDYINGKINVDVLEDGKFTIVEIDENNLEDS
jgi:ATP-dependent protease ClpP protease subunit